MDLSVEVRETLRKTQETFRVATSRVSWVRPSGMHLTLKFLGNIEERMIPEIGKRVRRVCLDRAPFPIRVAGLGVFPDQRRPRVLWAGVQDGADRLMEIVRTLDPFLAELGFPRSKRVFHPHITLGRIKEIRDRQRFSHLLEKNRGMNAGIVTVDSLRLIESRLHRDGAVYDVRMSVALREGPGPESGMKYSF